MTSGSTALSRYLYTGQEYDADVGLYYYNARWYDPKIGRFLSEDPLGFAAGDLNLSRYVNNGPTNAIDPSGLEEFNWARERLLQDLLREAQARGDYISVQLLYDQLRRLHGAWDQMDPPMDPFESDFWTGYDEDDVVRKQTRLAEGVYDAAETYVDIVERVSPHGNVIFLARNPTDRQAWFDTCPFDPFNQLKRFTRPKKLVERFDDIPYGGIGFADGMEDAARHRIRTIRKAVNSDIVHAAERAMERGVFPDKKSAADALRELTRRLTSEGFPPGTIPDPRRKDSVLVPFGSGWAVYEIQENGTAILRTVLGAN